MKSDLRIFLLCHLGKSGIGKKHQLFLFVSGQKLLFDL
jgi:hypothetical protein